MEQTVQFCGFADVEAGIVKWPMSVLRLRCKDRERLAALADRILQCWRGYSDETAQILAYTDAPHNTIAPIARRRGADYELDLVLRNNRTTLEYPLGLFHPHAELHHIKKENIGLIEVMGLAILPSRLKQELAELETALLSGAPLTGELGKHAQWAKQLQRQYSFTQENITGILQKEVGLVFVQVLEHAGVYPRTAAGREAFVRFVKYVNQEVGE